MTLRTHSQSPDSISHEAASVEHNTGAWISRWASDRPDSLAWADAERRCNYACAEDRIQRLTAWLAGSGVGRGDRVALWLGNRGATLEALFAAARLGAILLPVNARLTPQEVAFQFDDATPGLVLVERAWRERAIATSEIMSRPPPRLLEVGISERSLERESNDDDYENALAASTPSDLCEAVWPDDPMVLMYTSGTTGTPKGALLPHRKTLYNSLNAEIFFGLRREDRVLVVLPLFHSFGLAILAIPTLFVGATVELHPQFSPVEVWRSVERNRIAFFGGVPVMFKALLAALDTPPARDFDRSSLRFLFTAGASIPVEVVRSFEDHGLVLKQGFGQTETSILCCLEAEDAVRKAGSVGRPVVHGEVRIVALDCLEQPTAQWRDTAPGEKGEIVVRGPIAMLGYWNRPEATAETLRGEWLRTGDLATIDDEGFITLVARAREMYISGGENVYPAEVENTFAEHPAVREVAVIGIPDVKWGATGRAYVVPAENIEFDAEALLTWAGERLARFKLPREIVVLGSLPRTASGKVQKHRLAEINSR